jgi:hypothetical protein
MNANITGFSGKDGMVQALMANIKKTMIAIVDSGNLGDC